MQPGCVHRGFHDTEAADIPQSSPALNLVGLAVALQLFNLCVLCAVTHHTNFGARTLQLWARWFALQTPLVYGVAGWHTGLVHQPGWDKVIKGTPVGL